MSTCVICRSIFQPTKISKDSRCINNILRTCSKFLKPDVFQGSANLELLIDHETVSSLCERCYIIGKKLAVLNNRLDAIQKEINTLVGQFTETILGDLDYIDKAFCNQNESNTLDIKVENFDDDISDLGTDCFTCENVNIEGTGESNDLNTFNTVTSHRSANIANQYNLKQFCIKLERLPEDAYFGLNTKRKNSSKRKSVRKPTLSFRKECKGDYQILISGDEKDLSRKNRKETTKKKPSDQEKVERFECVPCGFKCLSKEKLENHEKRHLEKPLKCPECEKYFLTKWARRSHRNAAHPSKNNTFQCKLCEESNFSSQYDLEVHILAHNDEIPFKCFSCGKMFSNLLDYATHQRQSPCPVNTSHIPSSCGLCGKNFKSKFTMLVHLSEHNKPTVGHKCAVCTKWIARRQPLENHILTHVEECPYSCDICQRPSRTSQSLNDHRKTHTASSSFKCKYCNLSFGTKNNLVRHTFVAHTHTGEIFKCETCGWEFKIKDDYRRHLAIHSKSIICDVCGKAFNRMVDLKAHRRTHTGEMFSCANCEKQFVSPYLLNQHVSNAHGIANNLEERVRNRIKEKKKRIKKKSAMVEFNSDINNSDNF